MKVLILGSQGFIGSHLVEYFITNGHEVTGCDLIENDPSGYTYNKVSVMSPDFDSVFLNNHFEVCINASGSGNVSFSIVHPIIDFEANAISVARILDTIRKYDHTCKYIHISSAAVYGNPGELPIKENSAISPLSPYGFHKWMSETICKEYYSIYNLPIAIVRPFSVYGNRLKKQLLWDICQKLSEKDEIMLYGTGNETRDFIHISDLCRLIGSVLASSSFNVDIYNAASGIETSIHEISEMFEASFPGNKKISFSGEFKPGDPINWKADMLKLGKMGFESKVHLDIGIREYIEWYLTK